MANITSNTSEVDAAAVSVASNIVEDLTESAIENEEVSLPLFVIKYSALCLYQMPQVRENYLDIIDNIVSTDRETLVESQEQSSSSTK